MNARTFALGLCLASSPVLAGELVLSFDSGMSLRTGLPTPVQPQLEVLPRALLAQNGIRRANQSAFHPFAALELGGRYIARDEQKVEYVIEVRSIVLTEVHLSVEPRDPHANEPPTETARYHLVGYQIADTDPAQPPYPELVLFSDGSYRLGGAKGMYVERDGHLALDGYYGSWGVASLSRQSVVFKFERMGLEVKATMERVDAVAHDDGPPPATHDDGPPPATHDDGPPPIMLSKKS